MLSVVVLTKNEEKNIMDCLETLSFADEILIVDDFSEDRTLEVIKSLEDKKIIIFQRTLNGDFSAQRNFGLEHSHGDWVFFVDADERVSKILAEEIRKIIIVGKGFGYSIRRVDTMWSKELHFGEFGNTTLLRLGRKGKGKWKGKVHEVWDIKGRVDKLKNPLYHYPHQSISEFLSEINYYTSIRSKELFQLGEKTSWFDILLYPKSKFILNYIIRQGFRDGTAGFILAIFMSFHSFLVRAKLWLLVKEKEKLYKR